MRGEEINAVEIVFGHGSHLGRTPAYDPRPIPTPTENHPNIGRSDHPPRYDLGTTQPISRPTALFPR